MRDLRTGDRLRCLFIGPKHGPHRGPTGRARRESRGSTDRTADDEWPVSEVLRGFFDDESTSSATTTPRRMVLTMYAAERVETRGSPASRCRATRTSPMRPPTAAGPAARSPAAGSVMSPVIKDGQQSDHRAQDSGAQAEGHEDDGQAAARRDLAAHLGLTGGPRARRYQTEPDGGPEAQRRVISSGPTKDLSTAGSRDRTQFAEGTARRRRNGRGKKRHRTSRRTVNQTRRDPN